MEEINKKTLIEALSALKEYDPPPSVWQNINLEMDTEHRQVVPPDLLQELPEHNPPELVWRRISSRLDASAVPIRRIRWKKNLAVAASVIFLAAAYFTFQKKNISPPTVTTGEFTFHYSTELMDYNMSLRDWQEDEAAFEIYKELCRSKKYICVHPEFIQLQNEFNELTEAVRQLETAIGKYSTNPDLIIQIKEIELERTDLFKKMMVMLI